MAEAGVSSVIDKVVNILFGVAKKEISYMWNCKKNVEKLASEAETLNIMRQEVQQQIDIANRKGDNLKYGVQEWMKTASEKISTAEIFLKEEAAAKKMCFKVGICGNWGTLHRYGKRATEMISSLKEHQVKGVEYKSCVSVETPPPGPLDVYQNKNLDDMDTHKMVLAKIMAAIEDDSIQIIGIYGLGGVGKTTLAKEVASKVKNQFDDVAITTVSQSVNVDKITKDIGNASKQIMQRKKILIILDDVWEKLNLEELCIPCGINHKNCKILLTTRSEDVCNKMNVHVKIYVNPLPIKETWILFKQIVNETRIETDATLKQVALKVAEECGGLPLLVQAVGSALKDKSIDVWKSALNRLKKDALNIDPDIKKAYTHLKLSYDYLDNEEAKSCFLMCSMYPEDKLILLEDLVYCRVGLQKVNAVESLNDARDMIRNAVNLLTSSGLLLKEKSQYGTKMHDVVRDVALLIASEGKNKFLVEAGKGLSEWLPRKDTLESYTGISLIDNKICKLPDYEISLPHLTTFFINNNNLSKISDDFIGSMKEARVVDMSWNEISSLPQSFKHLTKLRMLDLRGNRSLDKISILGELKNLEILILRETGIKVIPIEIGQLVNLKRFDVSSCLNLYHISPGVLLKLCYLEELCIGFYSRMHQREIFDRLVEVMKLSKLTNLDLLVPCSDVIPKGFNWENLNSFLIQIGRFQNLKPWSVLERRLIFSTKYLKTTFFKSIENLIKVNPITTLDSIENLNNVMPTLYHEGFNKLESIKLKACYQVRWLVDWDELQNIDSFKKRQLGDDDQGKTEEMVFMNLKHLYLFDLRSLEVVWKCPDEYISLSNLVKLSISLCPRLVRGVFTVSVAQGLVSLQELSIIDCRSLEEVIYGGDDEETEMATNTIVFPSLAKIFLYELESLKSFCSGNSTIKYPSLVQVMVVGCRSMKKWCDEIKETPNLKFLDTFADAKAVLNEFRNIWFG